mgnify:CR=1 FL=1
MNEYLEDKLVGTDFSFEKAQKKQKENQEIPCAFCDNYQLISEIEIIQTHWYEEPRGCSDGDCWHEAELQFICSQCDGRNRLLFDNSDVPYESRKKFEFNPEEQFKRMYLHLFKQVIKEYESDYQRGIVNNYIDNNRALFQLFLKQKKE